MGWQHLICPSVSLTNSLFPALCYGSTEHHGTSLCYCLMVLPWLLHLLHPLCFPSLFILLALSWGWYSQDFLRWAKSRCVMLMELQLWNESKHITCFTTSLHSPCKGHTLNNHNHTVRPYSRLMRSLVRQKELCLCEHCMMLAIGVTCHFLLCWFNLLFELLGAFHLSLLSASHQLLSHLSK